MLALGQQGGFARRRPISPLAQAVGGSRQRMQPAAPPDPWGNNPVVKLPWGYDNRPPHGGIPGGAMEPGAGAIQPIGGPAPMPPGGVDPGAAASPLVSSVTDMLARKRKANAGMGYGVA